MQGLLDTKKMLNLNVAMNANWENTGYIQEATWNLISCTINDETRAHSISMICTELVENAVKYGDSDYQGKDAIKFNMKGSESEIIIEVKNKIKDEQEANVRRLDETIQWIRGYQNPFEAYMDRLYWAAKSTGDESMMGMVRMAYEGQAILDFYLNENNEIAISATVQLKN